MRSFRFLLLVYLGLTSCIQTDEVEDSLSNFRIVSERQFIVVGEDLQLQAVGTNEFGDEFAVFPQWATSDADVVTIDAGGFAHGISPGQASVTATYKETPPVSFLLTVVDPSELVAYIRVTGAAANLQPSQSRQLAATAYDINDMALADVTFEWQTSNSEVAVVDATGLVTAVANGTCEIAAIHQGKASQPYVVTVSDAAIREGAFEGAAGHQARGTAMLSAYENGVRLMFSEDFFASNGPGLYVYLSQHPNSTEGGIELAPLTVLEGPSSYDVNNVTLNAYDYVLIYCKPFKVVVGRALLN